MDGVKVDRRIHRLGRPWPNARTPLACVCVARCVLHAPSMSGNVTTIPGAPVPRMTADAYDETQGSALQRPASALTNARSHNGRGVRDGSSCEQSAQTEV